GIAMEETRPQHLMAVAIKIAPHLEAIAHDALDRMAAALELRVEPLDHDPRRARARARALRFALRRLCPAMRPVFLHATTWAARRSDPPRDVSAQATLSRVSGSGRRAAMKESYQPCRLPLHRIR